MSALPEKGGPSPVVETNPPDGSTEPMGSTLPGYIPQGGAPPPSYGQPPEGAPPSSYGQPPGGAPPGAYGHASVAPYAPYAGYGAPPVVYQPQPMAQQSTVVVQQNTTNLVGYERASRAWSTGLCGCCDDCSSCCCVMWFPTCYVCYLSSEMGESCCLPCIAGQCGTTTSLRIKIRSKYNIQGSICDDHLIMCCCWACATCQLAREWKNIRHSQPLL